MESKNIQLNICYNCMSKLEAGEQVCLHCGSNNAARSNPENVLPEGTILFRKYLVGRMIGRGGFGVTYIGYDLDLQLKVAIKEYFPVGVSLRSSRSYDVVSDVSTSQDHTAFSKGCEAFLDEARMLASVNSPYIVHVRDLFREHGTAYIVMDYVEGQTLPQVMQENGGRIEANLVIQLMLPLIEQLDKLHERNIIHRDIKPDNIMVVNDWWGNHLVLLDFGAARSFVSGNISKTYTAVVTPGFAPPEQYSQKSRQGAFTDVYGLCATMYYAITGVIPPTATERSADNAPISSFRSYGLAVPQTVEAAIMHGLALRSTDRTQTMKELYDELTVNTDRNQVIPKNNRNTQEEYSPRHTGQRRSSPVKQNTASRKKRQKKKSGVKVFLFSLLILCVAGLGIFLFGERKDSQNLSTILTTESPKPTTLDVTPEPTQPPQATPPVHIFLDNVGVGGSITFGSYEQDNDLTNGKEPIEWQVLDVQDKKALLVSKYALDFQPYHAKQAKETWETCDLRAWLNNTFIYTAFSDAERENILYTEVKADKYSNSKANAGNDTKDAVFLLSIREVNRYFDTDSGRQCELTTYAKTLGSTNNVEYCRWWLRSTGIHQNAASVVKYNGSINGYGEVISKKTAVRPAMWVSVERVSTNTEENDSEIIVETRAEQEAISTKLQTLEKAEIGDYVMFGTYEQDNDLTNGKEPIEWLVLDVQDRQALLISRYGLDCQRYNSDTGTISWQYSSLRKWLNSAFLETAFTTNEQKRIPKMMVSADRNPDYSTLPEFAVNDQVFLLSLLEANKYFSSDDARKCLPTAYAEIHGCFSDPDEGNCWWWLRTQGATSDDVTRVRFDGKVDSIGYLAIFDYCAVRPAIWVNKDLIKE